MVAAGPAERALVWAVAGDAGGLVVAGAEVFEDLAAVGAAADAGEWMPDVVVVCSPRGGGGAVLRGRVVWALGVVQAWLGDERLAGARLVVVTERAAEARRRAGGSAGEGRD